MDEQALDLTHGLTIDELAEAVGVPVRTIRYYVAEELLPGPGGRGKAALYGEEHLLRLRLIRLLSEQRVPLADIRERLRRLALDELRSLVAEEESRHASLRRLDKAPSPRAYISALLQSARAARRPSVPRTSPSGSDAQQHLVFNKMLERPSPRPRDWRHWELAPGLELHVRSDCVDQYRRLIERLLREAVDSTEP